MRDKTRRERYDKKKTTAITFPIDIVCINFQHDGNLGYLIRSAACFGASRVHVIGTVPPRSILDPLSGSLYDYVKIKQHSSPMAFLDYVRDKEIGPVALVVGNEEIGIPIEILKNSKKIHIPMPGIGYCLNTSQTANIILYETVKQYQAQKEHEAKRQIEWDEQGWYNLP